LTLTAAGVNGSYFADRSNQVTTDYPWTPGNNTINANVSREQNKCV